MTLILFVMMVSFLPLACSDERPRPPAIESQSTAGGSRSEDAAPPGEDAAPVPGGESEVEKTADTDGTSDTLDREGETSEADPLHLALQSWQTWAPRCETWPAKENCDDGDATLFSALLCAADHSEACQAVAASQSSDGRFWRSPRRVNSDSQNSFSRDMAVGVLLYLLHTKDRVAAQSWMSWIDGHTVCQLGSESSCALRVYKLCSDDTDGRCIVTPAIWAMAGRVWQVLGLPPHSEMMRWQAYAEDRYLGEAESVPLGYALHLKAVTLLIYQRLQLRLSFERPLAQSLIKRQPQNLFFRYLARESPQEIKDGLLKLCPLDPPSRMHQWNWERDAAEEAWLESMGWDCVFLARLLLAERR